MLMAALRSTAELWTSVFNFACDLQRHDDAYAAAVANPLPERAAESIKRLVQVGISLGIAAFTTAAAAAAAQSSARGG